MTPDPRLVDRLALHGQEQLLRWWKDLDTAGRERLTREIAAINLDEIDTLVAELVRSDVPSAPPRTASDPSA